MNDEDMTLGEDEAVEEQLPGMPLIEGDDNLDDEGEHEDGLDKDNREGGAESGGLLQTDEILDELTNEPVLDVVVDEDEELEG